MNVFSACRSARNSRGPSPRTPIRASLGGPTYPAPDGSIQTEGIINPNVFREAFAADLPARTTAVMAAAQRPAALAALGEPSGPPAWKTIPSWYLVAGKDNAIGTDLERFMANRIPDAHTIEIKNSSHVAMISHPDETTQLILRAAGDGRGRSHDRRANARARHTHTVR